MKLKTTEGPWEAHVDKNDQPQILYSGLVALIGDDAENYLSVTTDGSSCPAEDWKANTLAISRVPEMLAFIVDIIQFGPGHSLRKAEALLEGLVEE